MINISFYNKRYNNDNIIDIMSRSFGVTKNELNLVNNKTLVISLIINKEKVGAICIISNNDLYDYMIRLGKNIEELNGIYLFRATKGAYIYNMAVDKRYRGHGIAQKLLDISLYVSKIKKFEYCYSHCENQISHYIFKKKGFNNEKHFKNSLNKEISLMSYWLK